MRTRMEIRRAGWTLAAALALVALGMLSLGGRAAPQQDAATIYRQKCALCHAQDGSGNTAKGRSVKAKDLRSPAVQAMSDAALADAIAKGKGTNMDGYADELSKDQIQALVAYIRQLAKK